MTEQTSILIVLALAAVVIGLFVFNARQKRRFEDERAERRRKLEAIKAEARAKSVQETSE
jgi:uncharacterized membrane protein